MLFKALQINYSSLSWLRSSHRLTKALLLVNNILLAKNLTEFFHMLKKRINFFMVVGSLIQSK